MKNNDPRSIAAGNFSLSTPEQKKLETEILNHDKSGGLILLNKPPGITSFKSLNVLKKKLQTGKVGHTGTLDKFAEGLIVALYGKMTKLVPEFTGMDKEYIAQISFGEETETLDPEGIVVARATSPQLSTIESVIPEFIGKIQQSPPQYSAIHINGQRAYEMARSGKEFEMPSREIEIYSFEIISYLKSSLQARIRCSKGTYIRSLARDLALKCNSRAHLTSLKRTEVGTFSVNDSVSSEIFNKDIHTFTPWKIFDYLPQVKKIVINDKYLSDIKMGREKPLEIIGRDFESGEEYALFDERLKMVALVSKRINRIAYRFVC